MNEARLGYPHKIVTCCYCGTRAALVLTGRTRHELSCSRCGAPLHDLKMLPKARAGAQREVADRRRRGPMHPPTTVRAPKYPRRRKGLLRRVVAEAFDLLEEIFD